MLSTLNHDNIIKVKDRFRVDGGKFVSVMEYQPSHSLESIVNDAKSIMRKNKQFAAYCYLVRPDGIHL